MTRQGATRGWSRMLHAASFGSAAEAYERGRPPYPRSALEWAVPRGHSEPWVALLDNILHQHTRQELNTEPELGAPFENLERTEIRRRHRLSRAALLDMVASRSYVIVLP
jgi:hypothetical protein